jgi:hypothetical protein
MSTSPVPPNIDLSDYDVGDLITEGHTWLVDIDLETGEKMLSCLKDDTDINLLQEVVVTDALEKMQDVSIENTCVSTKKKKAFKSVVAKYAKKKTSIPETLENCLQNEQYTNVIDVDAKTSNPDIPQPVVTIPDAPAIVSNEPKKYKAKLVKPPIEMKVVQDVPVNEVGTTKKKICVTLKKNVSTAPNISVKI